MYRLASLVAVATFAAWSGSAGTLPADPPEQPQTRRVQLEYRARLPVLPKGSRVRIWYPVPREDEVQQVSLLHRSGPGEARLTWEATHGNRIVYHEATVQDQEPLEIAARYLVTRFEVRALQEGCSRPATLAPEKRRLYLSPNQGIPIGGKPALLLRAVPDTADPVQLGRQLYDLVDAHMQYDKSRPGYGRGDAEWACDSGYGNCSDFHSLFIAFCRTRNLPARFVIGFPLPEKEKQGSIGGYHCWAYFFVEKRGWIPVDISEADKHPEMRDYYFGSLTPHRVAFTVGRDLVLEPPQNGPPLNFFVYPYVEVNGQPLPQDQITLNVTFADVP